MVCVSPDPRASLGWTPGSFEHFAVTSPATDIGLIGRRSCSSSALDKVCDEDVEPELRKVEFQTLLLPELDGFSYLWHRCAKAGTLLFRLFSREREQMGGRSKPENPRPGPEFWGTEQRPGSAGSPPGPPLTRKPRQAGSCHLCDGDPRPGGPMLRCVSHPARA